MREKLTLLLYVSHCSSNAVLWLSFWRACIPLADSVLSVVTWLAHAHAGVAVGLEVWDRKLSYAASSKPAVSAECVVLLFCACLRLRPGNSL